MPGQWRISSTPRRRQYSILFVLVLVILFFLNHPAHIATKLPPEPEETPAPSTDQQPKDDSVQQPANSTAPENPKTHWPYPPSWDKLRQWEDDLPQHNLDLPIPEGSNGRYVKFSNQVWGLGWNNALNEILMNTHLAYESRRAYVFRPYLWKETHYPWPVTRLRMGEVRPSTPLNAIISGPSAGGPWDEGDDAPRSVSEVWFDTVCPPSQRRIINSIDVKPIIGWADGIDIFNYWKNILLEAPERCIEIQPAHPDKDYFPQTFDLWLWGSARVLSLWQTFSKSPVSRLLEPSPIVKAAVDRNEYLFIPRGPRPERPTSRSPYDRMLAIHIRRGDFKESCVHLATWNSTFYSWNLLGQLPDPFVPPPGGGYGTNTPENIEKYLRRCLPTFDDIVHRVRDSRKEFVDHSTTGLKTLDIAFLLTNEQGEWLDQLKATLKEDGWHTIVTSRDLVLDLEQTEVNMAVDMEIARRAAIFIGNGWSSFTSNIVHKRLVDEKEPLSCRFY